MRTAPSRRITSPLRYVLVRIVSTSAPNSPGSPSRGGNGMLACAHSTRARRHPAGRRVAWPHLEARDELVGGGGHHRRAEDARCDGDEADAERREIARDGKGHRNDRALRRRVRHLTRLPVERSDARRVHNGAALAARPRLAPRNALGGEAEDVERADDLRMSRKYHCGARRTARCGAAQVRGLCLTLTRMTCSNGSSA